MGVEASHWLYKKRKWRQKEMHWSINKDTPKLDRAGIATNTRFWRLPHEMLSRLLKFELLHNNTPIHCKPMGHSSIGQPVYRWGAQFLPSRRPPYPLACEATGQEIKGNLQVSEEGSVF